jgi:N6-L-threonylcarbamoyladenine synthase
MSGVIYARVAGKRKYEGPRTALTILPTMTTGAPHLVLGIETSCDETATAVVARDAEGRGQILSNVVRSQWAEHLAFGGVVPELAARAHLSCLDQIVSAALKSAGVGLPDITVVAATAGPGLIGGLLVGVVTGKALALAARRPFIAVNHLEAHALTVGLTDDVRPPYLLLLVSGGHTQLLLVLDVGRYMRLGTTIDDALGEAFDKTAKLLGLGLPGGPAVETQAAMGDPKRFAFPRPMSGRAEPHFSFAGLKTAVRLQAEALQPLTVEDIRDLCASFQRAVAHSVAERCACAMAIADDRLGAGQPRRLVIAGGVAANMELRSTLFELAAARGYTCHVPPIALCGDNAAMIAWTGAEHAARGIRHGFDHPVHPRWPLDLAAPPAIGAGVKA